MRCIGRSCRLHAKEAAARACMKVLLKLFAAPSATSVPAATAVAGTGRWFPLAAGCGGSAPAHPCEHQCCSSPGCKLEREVSWPRTQARCDGAVPDACRQLFLTIWSLHNSGSRVPPAAELLPRMAAAAQNGALPLCPLRACRGDRPGLNPGTSTGHQRSPRLKAPPSRTWRPKTGRQRQS